MHDEDAELLRRFADRGDQAAFAQLVRRHIGFVHGVALRRMRNAHDAEDVTQAVFVALARKAEAVAGRASLAGWLHRSACFEALNIMRQRDHRAARELEAQRRAAIGSENTAIQWDAIGPVLDDALEELPDKDRDAVFARFFAGESYAAVAARLRLTESGARMRVERALDKLHAALTRRGVTTTAALLGATLSTHGIAAVPPSLALAVVQTAGTACAGTVLPATTIAFMSATKTTVTAGLLGVLGIGIALYQADRARSAQSSLATVAAERDALKARLIPRAPVPSNPVPSTRANPAAEKSSEVDVPRNRGWQVVSPANRAFESAEGRAAFIAREVARAKAKFRGFVAEAKLSPAQEAALENRLSTLAAEMLEYHQAMHDQGFGPMNPPMDPKVLAGLLKMENDVQATFESGVRDTLGERHFQEFNAYRKTIGERNVAEELTARLHSTGDALTAGQSADLVRILRENSYQPSATPSPANTLTGVPVAPVTVDSALVQSNLLHGDLMMPAISWSAPVTDGAVVRAMAVLSPTQVAALRALQAEQLARLQLAPSLPPGATPDQAGKTVSP